MFEEKEIKTNDAGEALLSISGTSFKTSAQIL
jgi:hypothetical protein